MKRVFVTILHLTTDIKKKIDGSKMLNLKHFHVTVNKTKRNALFAKLNNILCWSKSLEMTEAHTTCNDLKRSRS